MIARLALLAAVAILLARQEPIQKFIDEMEKQYANGADAQSLADAIERYCKGRPLEVRARLEWNRQLFTARSELLKVFVEAMKGKIGSKVDVGDPPNQQSGKVLEVRDDRLVLELRGGRIEILYLSLSLPYLARAAKTSPTPTPNDCIAAASTGNLAAAAEAWNKIEDADAKTRTAGALAGLLLQRLDGHVQAKRFDKAYADLTGAWMKHEAILDASEGSLRTYSGETYPTALLLNAEDLAKKDKKGARKLLDQAQALAKPAELRTKVVAALWAAMTSGEWLQVALDESIKLIQGELENGRITGDDPTTEAGVARPTKIEVPGIPTEEVVGMRGRINMGTANIVGFRWVQNAATQAGQAVSVDHGSRKAGHTRYPDKGPPSEVATTDVPKKEEYDLSIDAHGGRIRCLVDGKEIFVGAIDKRPCESLWFVKNDGKAFLLSLALRKK